MPPARKAQMLDNDVTAIVTIMKTSQLEWPPAADVLPKINVPTLLFAAASTRAPQYAEGGRRNKERKVRLD